VVKRDRGLGRGLDALLSSGIDMEESKEIKELPAELIDARSDQPRKIFNEESLKELAESIREYGVLQPVLVRPKGEKYEIIAGERRYRAAQIAGIEVIPALVKEIDDVEADEISLIENLQRENLNPIEEAVAYKKMIEKYNYTQESLGKRIGKSRAHITNTIRILNLPEEIKEMIEKGKITAGHARTILSLREKDDQISAAREIVEGKMSVRETERRIKGRKGTKRNIKNKRIEIIDLEERLQRHFGTRTEIVEKEPGGRIEVFYYNQEELERILEILGIG